MREVAGAEIRIGGRVERLERLRSQEGTASSEQRDGQKNRKPRVSFSPPMRFLPCHGVELKGSPVVGLAEIARDSTNDSLAMWSASAGLFPAASSR